MWIIDIFKIKQYKSKIEQLENDNNGYRILDWIKIHPVYSILISSVYAISLGIFSSYLFSLF